MKMVTKVYLMISLTLLSMQLGRSNVIDFLNAEEQEKEKPCENLEEGSEEKDKCLEELCSGNENRFECQALKCKLRFPISLQSNNLKQNMSRLRCVKRVCSSNKSEAICQNLEKCDSNKKEPLGEAKYIICITKLFL